MLRTPTGRRPPILLSLVALIGCQADLPPCDPMAAREIVFLDAPSDVTRDDGVPMYAGQALMHLSCGAGTYCHAAGAEGGLRLGTPITYDFDVAPVCFDSSCTPGDATLAAFEDGVDRARRSARHAYDLVVDGLMPPGRLGGRVASAVRVGRAIRLQVSGALADGVPLPPVDALEGRRILGNWLACGAPVVQTVRSPDGTHAPGDLCDAAPGDLGDCVTRLDTGVFAPDPARTWTYAEIYEHLIDPLCAQSCHGSAEPNVDEPRFGPDAATTLARLLEEDGDETLVVPGDPNASHLQHHLAGHPGIVPMPTHLVTGRLPIEVIAAVGAWIDDGANP